MKQVTWVQAHLYRVTTRVHLKLIYGQQGLVQELFVVFVSINNFVFH